MGSTYNVYNSYDQYNAAPYHNLPNNDGNVGFGSDHPAPAGSNYSGPYNGTLQQEWNAVNWVINNYPTVLSAPYNLVDVQAVIWQLLHPEVGNYLFVNGFNGVDAAAQTLFNAAITNLSFTPTAGVVAVILDPGAGAQGVIIEVPLPSGVCSNNSSVALYRCVSVTSANAFQQITYGYTVVNTGSTTLTNIVVTDDNGTPDYVEDDFVAGTIPSLNPGQSKSFNYNVYLPVRLFAQSGSNTIFDTLVIQPPGTVIATGTPGGSSFTVPNGEIYLHYLLDTDVMDNTFGATSSTAGASSDWAAQGGHQLWQDINNNTARFAFYNSWGQEVSDFYEDFLTYYGYPNGGAAQSGYGTAGLHGAIRYGSASFIAGLGTSISDDVNEWSFYQGGIPNGGSAISPDSSPTWETISSYKALLNFSSNFGSVAVISNFIGYSKIGNNLCYSPQVITTQITDTAYVLAYNGCCPVKAHASVCVTLNGCPPPNCNNNYQHKCQHKEECRCTCSQCQNGHHEQCSQHNCSDVRCADKGCPQQCQCHCVMCSMGLHNQCVKQHCDDSICHNRGCQRPW
jgi:hypothetical protein